MACFGLNLLGIAVWLSVQKLLLLRGVPYLPLIVLTYAIGAAAVAVTAVAAFLRRPAVWPLSTSGLLALGSRPRVHSVAPAHEAPEPAAPPLRHWCSLHHPTPLVLRATRSSSP